MPPKTTKTKSRKTKVKKEVVINQEQVDSNNEEPIKDYETNVISVEYEVGKTHGEIARLEKKLRREAELNKKK